MLKAEVQNTLRESQLARRLIGVLQSNEGFMGFYGENPGIISSGDYPVPGHSHEEVREILWKLRQEGLLDFTFSGCGPNVYCFDGENHVSKSRRFSGYMESRFEVNPEIRTAIADFLKAEFPDEGLIQEVYTLQFKGKTTDREALRIFDLGEVAQHYAQELGVEVSTLDKLRHGNSWGDYDWNNPRKRIAEWVKADQPYVVLDDGHGINFLLAAQGNRIRILGLSYGVMCDATKKPNEYNDDLRLMSPVNPFEEPFLQGLIDRYDNPTGRNFTSTVDLGQVGLRFKDPKYTMEQICQSDSGFMHQFRV